MDRTVGVFKPGIFYFRFMFTATAGNKQQSDNAGK
jgi:hypothetical protein